MAIELRSNSRLRFVPLLTDQGVVFWDIFEPPTIPAQPDDIQYQVVGSDRIDLLAQKFYGDPVFWWVIAVANDMEILPTDLKDGAILLIPSPRYVTSQLFARALNG